MRQDLFILHKLLILTEEKAGVPEERLKVLESLKNFMLYFESLTFKLLRYDDYDEFASFFNEVFSFKDPDFNIILEKIHNFRIFLETTISHIDNRAELRDNPMDIDRIEEIVKQYL